MTALYERWIHAQMAKPIIDRHYAVLRFTSA